MRRYILEACVDSLESAIIATEAGANRLELCANLVIGGTTPSAALFREVKKKCDCEIRVLIRPRFGDFCYTEHEFNIIKGEVRLLLEEGADGIVIGILRPDGSLDSDRMKELILLAEGRKVTLHRAFDVCADPLRTMEESIALGIDTILTSGQADTCLDGLDCIKMLHQKSAGRISLLIGSGVDVSSVERIYKETGIPCFHMSGKTVLDSSMTYRKEGVHMGLKGMSEYEILRTDKTNIRKVIEMLEQL